MGPRACADGGWSGGRPQSRCLWLEVQSGQTWTALLPPLSRQHMRARLSTSNSPRAAVQPPLEKPHSTTTRLDPGLKMKKAELKACP